MDKLEKVEKVRERANVSYEEAREALEHNNWDLLDAMVELEKTGKTEGPNQEHYSTSYDQQAEYIPVKATVEEQQKAEPRLGKSISDAFRSFIRICRDNSFCISYRKEQVLRIPLLAAVIILILTWKFSIPVMLVALLFSVRYSIEGKDNLEKVNAFMDSAGAAAESLKEGFVNAHERDRKERGNDEWQQKTDRS